MSNKSRKYREQPNRLARSEGQPIVMRDERQQLRYLYQDGSMDPKSKVQASMPAIEFRIPLAFAEFEALQRPPQPKPAEASTFHIPSAAGAMAVSREAELAPV